MSTLRDNYLTALGIQSWEQKNKLNTDVMIIADTDQALSIKAKRLLKSMMACIGIHHSQVYTIASIASNQPKLLLCIGKQAAQALLNTDMEFESLRGKRHMYGENGIPVIVTYHPDELLLQPLNKRKAFTDLQLLSS